jgi:hypothetical protein
MSLSNRALLLPDNDRDALQTGKTIVVSTAKQLRSGLTFALCGLPDVDLEYIPVHAWAELTDTDYLPNDDAQQFLIHQTPWTWDDILERRGSRSHLFIAALRVYQLPEPVNIPWNEQHRDRLGAFIPLGGIDIPTNTDRPVLDDHRFNQKLHALKTRQIPNPIEQCLEQLKSPPAPVTIPNWVSTIVSLGYRSREEDTGKSNYEAGTAFENIVKTSLEFLGFTIDEAHKGGAGGLDLYCSAPFPLVGECKAGKKIPNATTKQLAGLGITKLGFDGYKNAAKLIIGSGDPTPPMLEDARQHHIIIMNPETLEALVQLKARYPGAVNLRELEPILKSGDISQVEQYIANTRRQIELRRQILTALEIYQTNTQQESVSLQELRGAHNMQSPKIPLEELHLERLLYELSSPLLGHIGRTGDRYYHIRNLP